MQKKIIEIEVENLAKLITMQITGSLLIIGHTKLNAGQMAEIKQAVKTELENGTYLKAADTYDQIVYRVLN
jgi:hypothetical protein